MDTDLVTRMVLERGLIEPGVVVDEEILKNEGRLASIAGAWRGSRQAIEDVLKTRIYNIERELIGQATPAEVIILRDCMIHIAMIADDFIAYEAEFARREKAADNPPPVTVSNETTPEASTIADTPEPGTENSMQSSM